MGCFWSFFAPSQQKKRCLPTVSLSHFPLGKKTNKQTKRKQNNDNNNNNKLESIHQQIGQQQQQQITLTKANKQPNKNNNKTLQTKSTRTCDAGLWPYMCYLTLSLTTVKSWMDWRYM